MGINGKAAHFVLVPFLAPGHMIPMVDTGVMLAKRGVIVTILLTRSNGKRVKNAIDDATESGLSIRVSHLQLPCNEAGLPEGCESCDMLPSVDYLPNFFTAVAMLRDQVEQQLHTLQPMPTCLVVDMCFPWASNRRLQIPRFVFYVSNCFALLHPNMQGSPKRYSEAPQCDINDFALPDETPPYLAELVKEMYRAEETAFGTILINTFEELEPEYVEEYCKIRGRKLWCVGPISLCNKQDNERGNKPSIENHQCLKWLGMHEPSSVVYVCFGSSAEICTSQLIQLGLGLEASNRPFIWVIRDNAGGSEFKAWLSEYRFEEKTKGRALLIQGWAPQLLILSHPSVGGFVTHCGGNSIIEGFTTGLPMVTWPLFADQFCNEVFILNVTKTGVRAGGAVRDHVLVNEGVQVKSGDIKMAIDRLMDGGREGKERRERAWKIREMATRAVQKGGSSYRSMTQLIQDVVMQQPKQNGA